MNIEEMIAFMTPKPSHKMPQSVVDAIVEKLRAGEELANASRPVAHIVARTLKDTKTQMFLHLALDNYDKAGDTE